MTDVRPGIYNINLFQGEEFEVDLIFQIKYTGVAYPIDSSSKAVMTIQRARNLAPLVSLVLGNGLTITHENTLKVYMAPSVTDKLKEKNYQYDLMLLIDGTKPKYFIRGQITVINAISKIT